ncbi:hypothetical protein AB4254_11575 [Vibrio breoganii]
MSSRFGLMVCVLVSSFAHSASLGGKEEVLTHVAGLNEVKAICKAFVSNGVVVTAGHCTQGRTYLGNRLEETYFPDVNRASRLAEDVITYSPPSRAYRLESHVGECFDKGQTIDNQVCNFYDADGSGRLSLDCAFDKGESGKPIFNEAGEFCAVYIGYYLITNEDNNKSVRLGYFKDVELPDVR